MSVVPTSRPSAPQPPRKRPSARPASSPPQRKTLTWTTPGAGPQRQRIETASRRALIYAAATPRWMLLLVFAGLAVGGALLPRWWGAGCVAVLVVFLGWLLYLAWPSLGARQRPGRLLVIGVLIGAAVARVVLG